jgi:16S rRNA (cytosine1402-N4)-methyltransferase
MDMKNSGIYMKNEQPHISVLPNEIKDLVIRYSPVRAIDFTFGAGGHSRIILENSNCVLNAFDRDETTKVYANELKEKYKERFFFHNDVSLNLQSYISNNQNFILGDLGLSQMQLASDRGFAYNKNSDLQMSMGVGSLGDLKTILKNLTEEKIYEILMEYGEEPNSKSISRAIYIERNHINTSDELKKIVLSCIKRKIEENSTLSRCFQAFRIYINEEIYILEKTLQIAYNNLEKNGILAIITFHSLEDRAVKIFFKHKFKKNFLVVPTNEEMAGNNQSRSAKLRYGIKE